MIVAYLCFIITLFTIWCLLKYLSRKSILKIEFMSRFHTEILKAYAILGVVVGHVGQYLGLNGVEYPAGVGVSIFLILSGYGIETSRQRKGLTHFWKNRFWRVYIPYIIAHIIFCFLFSINNTLNEIIFGIFLIRPLNRFGWYLRYIFTCYLIFFTVCKLIKSKYKGIILISVFLCWFFIRSTVYIDPTPFLQARQMLCFPLGILMAHIQTDEIVASSFLWEIKIRMEKICKSRLAVVTVGGVYNFCNISLWNNSYQLFEYSKYAVTIF